MTSIAATGPFLQYVARSLLDKSGMSPLNELPASSPEKETAPLGRRRCEALGIIIPVEWDPSGNPSAWAISTYDENLYRIDTTTEKGRILGSFLGRKMAVSGVLDRAEGGRQKIEVETYVLLDDRQTVL